MKKYTYKECRDLGLNPLEAWILVHPWLFYAACAGVGWFFWDIWHWVQP